MAEEGSPAEARGVLADEGEGFVAARMDVREFAHLLVARILVQVLRRMEPRHPQALRAGRVAEAQLDAEVVANGHERAEDAVVANGPRGDEGAEERGGGESAGKPRALLPRQAPSQPY